MKEKCRPCSCHSNGAIDKSRRTRNVKRKNNTRYIGNRIEVLRSDAQLDGFAMNEVSEVDFWSFIESISFAQKSRGWCCWIMGIYVLSGKARMVATSGFSSSANRLVEYVIFKRRQATKYVSRVAGRDTIEGIKKQILASDLTVLMDV